MMSSLNVVIFASFTDVYQAPGREPDIGRSSINICRTFYKNIYRKKGTEMLGYIGHLRKSFFNIRERWENNELLNIFMRPLKLFSMIHPISFQDLLVVLKYLLNPLFLFSICITSSIALFLDISKVFFSPWHQHKKKHL